MWRIVCLLLLLVIIQISAFTLVLDPDEKFNVTVEKNETSITFKISAETTGWVGIGFSPNGAMTDADIIIGWVDGGTGFVKDYFAAANGAPSLDTSQDVELLFASESNGITSIEFMRPINSIDENDRTIMQDTTRLIYAYGNSDPSSADVAGSEYHGSTQRGVKSVYLLEYGPPIPELPNDVLEWTAAPTAVQVPDKTTVYWCTYHRMPALTEKHHVLKFSTNITSGNEAIVHHMLLYQCNGVTDSNVQAAGGGSHECYGENMPEFTKKCQTLVYGWAIGGEDMYAPIETGLPFEASAEGQYFLLETHYDNPQARADISDFSGITLTYSPTLRDNDFGVAYIGSVNGLFVPPGAERFSVFGYCDSACTNDFFPETGVTVFSYGLHSHTAGTGIQLEVKRKGADERTLLFSDMDYDFNFQQYRYAYPSVKLYPGDEVKVTCMMTTTGRAGPTWGGQATSDEMCLAFLNYYPKTDMGKCEGLPAYLLETNSTIYKYLDVEPTRFPGSFLINIEDLMNDLTWDESKIENAQKGVRESAYYSNCQTGSGDGSASWGRRVPVVSEGPPSSAETHAASTIILLISILSLLKNLM